MLKLIITALVLFSALKLWAVTPRDSLGVFYSPAKVTVLTGELAYRSDRIWRLMDSMSEGEHFLYTSEKSDVEMKCFRNERSASCTLTFLPSEHVKISPRQVQAKLPLSSFKARFNPHQMNFESANGDRFELKIDQDFFEVKASKKVIP